MYIEIATASLVILAILWWYLHRDPERRPQPYKGYLSPANGIVVDIINIKNNKHKIKKGENGITALLDDFPKGKTIVVIMMKPWHIHTQRAPSDGKITSITHKPGLKLNAVFGNYQKATVENEHVAITIAGAYPCKVYSIAGLLARRIKILSKKGQHIKQGERITKITFGSQVAIVLPKNTILVKKGETVIDGVTRLAR